MAKSKLNNDQQERIKTLRNDRDYKVDNARKEYQQYKREADFVYREAKTKIQDE